MGVDGLDASIDEVACLSFGSLFHSSYRYCDPALKWIQTRLATRDSGDYLEGTIRTCWNTTAQILVLGSFQGGDRGDGSSARLPAALPVGTRGVTGPLPIRIHEHFS